MVMRLVHGGVEDTDDNMNSEYDTKVEYYNDYMLVLG
jgi:hypothetical protein